MKEYTITLTRDQALALANTALDGLNKYYEDGYTYTFKDYNDRLTPVLAQITEIIDDEDDKEEEE